ncbi:MAG TPA: RagB/SusD family nutrient uptake outer membrane protein [Puia sp.]|uniref:RagB/SusD family nutrient uptake outer membrane protein n=1 Tax=Puia sp. TaxID=2045100 RepID=UPI002B6FEE81|nr:RagB/SusD family nutrient uptake outer membrane protein [Puia sp.]HVU95370.1 RagB/SusD family nutrient uptake outer membrane protein [Puia sp.]
MKPSYIFPLLLLLASCTKTWVDTKPYGSPSTANLWTDSTDALKGTAALYIAMKNESTWGRDLFWMQNAGDDLIVGRPKPAAENIKNFVCTGHEGYISQGWSDLYSMLNIANEAIAGLKNATALSASLRNRSLGEAYFMRGFAHFWIAYLWGEKTQGVPYDSVENPLYGKRIAPQQPSVTVNYSIIAADLQRAADLLPLFETYAPADQGRAHRAAALGYLVKTYAYWAQYDASKWSLIPDLVDRIHNECNRALITNQPTPAQNYRSVFTIANNWSSEYIWSVTSSNLGGSEFMGVVLENTGWGLYNGWGYFQPTEELYDEYEANDPRRAATILNFGDTFTYFGQSRQYYSTNSLSGFQLAKYMEPYSYGSNGDASTDGMVNPNGDYPTTALNLPLMRYAELLLFKAEALIQLGRNADAAAPLNEVRARVGLAPKSNPTLADLKHERRCELAGEWTDRFMDLKRWGNYTNIDMPLHGRIHSNKTDPASSYTIQQVWPARNFDPNRDMAWPFDPDEISRSNGAYKQTPGW